MKVTRVGDGAVAHSRFLEISFQCEQWRKMAEQMFFVAYVHGASENELKPFLELMQKMEYSNE